MPPAFPETIRKPDPAFGIPTGERRADGSPVLVGCATCHSIRPARPPRFDGAVGKPHTGLTFVHGTLSCQSCHAAPDYGDLGLADGRRIPRSEVMALCGQCHGPQLRDFAHGAHGGMNGYWDRSRGPRTRHSCIDCHDPHAPRYRGVMPAPGPRDRVFHPHKEGSR